VKRDYRPTDDEVQEWKDLNRRFVPVATIASRAGVPTKVVHAALFPGSRLEKGRWVTVDE
jgi:hypothetical protein